jgi:hypothetical protein
LALADRRRRRGLTDEVVRIAHRSPFREA